MGDGERGMMKVRKRGREGRRMRKGEVAGDGRGGEDLPEGYDRALNFSCWCFSFVW